MSFEISPNLSEMVSPKDFESRPCLEYRPDFFYPPDPKEIAKLGPNVIPFPGMLERAQAVCGKCLCSFACYTAAVQRGETEGIYGGVNFADFNT